MRKVDQVQSKRRALRRRVRKDRIRKQIRDLLNEVGLINFKRKEDRRGKTEAESV